MRKYLNLFILYLCVPVAAMAHGGKQSLEFIENRGQWDGPFRYQAETGGGYVYLQEHGFTYTVGAKSNEDIMASAGHKTEGKEPAASVLRYHAYRVTFDGAQKPEIIGAKPQKNYYNYYLGNDPARWKSDIHPCMAVDYNHLYAGIDMHIASENGLLKYEFIVAAGTDPSVIRMTYEGQDAIYLKGDNLAINTSVGEVQEMKPYAYQNVDGKRVTVPCSYKLKGNTVTYSFPRAYDESKPLIIDPTVVFATFSGSAADNWGFTATPDLQGNFYVGGLVHSQGFPVSTGAFQATFQGGVDTNLNSYQHGSGFACDIAIMKLDPTGGNRIYATYIGGSDNEQPHSMMVDANNNLVIAARTYSSNFPITPGAYSSTYGGLGDIAVIKLNATGTALIGSTFMGGSDMDGVNFHPSEYVYGNLKHNYGDDARSEVIIDNAGNIYVTACTKSANFPVTSNAIQPSLAGGQDAVVFKLNSTLTSLIWSTFLGGTNDDAGYVLALDNTQQYLYVAGGTGSSNFPGTGGTYQPSYQGGATDGFIARFQNSGSYPLQKVTFIGTGNLDQVYGVQVDGDNNVYAMGQSVGGTFPVSSGVYSNPGSTQFIIKLNADLSTRIFSTVFGSGNSSQTNISPVAFLVDTCQNIYISGWGGSLDGTNPTPTVGTCANMPLTADAAQSITDGQDFYFIVLSRNASTLLYATYMGRIGGVGEHVDGGTSRFDKNGVVYQAICGGCGGGGFPTTPGSWSPNNQSSNCNMVALKIAFQLGAVNAHAAASPSTSGCPPLNVQFQNSSANAVGYEWYFGDGTSSTSAVPPLHTYTTPGVYDVMLVAINQNACNKARDTTHLQITVDTNRIAPGFTYTILDSCGPYRASFNNTSVFSHTPGASGFTTFQWSFGDGTGYTGANPPTHSYASGGTYNVTLLMRDSTACNSPDSIVIPLKFNALRVQAGLNLPDSICISSGINFQNNSVNSTATFWDFGDGQSSTQYAPVHTYSSPGTYEVLLVAINPASCNGTDSVYKRITLIGAPVAAFSYSPTIPTTNSPIYFTNQSQNATSYLWLFGDGTTSIQESPSHMYRQTGTFSACLVARNAGCSDTVCRNVESDVKGIIDVPTAFSPNKDGHNDILYVRGGAIETMYFRLYNRFGELVFETRSLEKGWDGTYKGKPQDMDAFAYILEATFIDGKNVRKTGNITLLR